MSVYAGLPTTKTCRDCGRTKFAHDFGVHRYMQKKMGSASGSRGGEYLRSPCKPCASKRARRKNLEVIAETGLTKERTYSLAREYGMTPEAFTERLLQQHTACAICSHPFSTARNDVPCVDHDHDTGVVRGILCRKCNLGLGLLGDNATRLRAVLAYLEG